MTIRLDLKKGLIMLAIYIFAPYTDEFATEYIFNDVFIYGC